MFIASVVIARLRVLDASREHRRGCAAGEEHRVREEGNARALMRCAVVGAGAWGTALADLLARNGHDVQLVGVRARRRRVGQHEARERAVSSVATRSAPALHATGDHHARGRGRGARDARDAVARAAIDTALGGEVAGRAPRRSSWRRKASSRDARAHDRRRRAGDPGATVVALSGRASPRKS